jgi:broad specificity phosphatase PhoE
MTSTSQRFVLLRHGETEWSRNGRHTGHTDLPLLPEGERQAVNLRPLLEPYQFTAVWTSPLLRARRTGELAGLGDVAVVDPDLSEWDYGAYEGLTTPEIRAERPGWDLFDDGAPGGETAAEVAARADRVIERVRATPGDVVAVAHSHLLRVLAARWIGLEPAYARHLMLDPASLSLLGWDRDHPVIKLWNHRGSERP